MIAVGANTNRFQPNECGLFEWFDGVSGANHPAFENVRSEASSVSERLQYAILSDTLKVITWFTQPIPATDGVTDSEPSSNEMIESDVTSFDVPSVLSRCEFYSRFTFDCCNGLLFDQREVVPVVAFLVRPPVDEGPGFDFAEISITPEATPGDGFDVPAFGHFDFGFGSSEDAFDSSSTIHTLQVLVLYQMACARGDNVTVRRCEQYFNYTEHSPPQFVTERVMSRTAFPTVDSE